MRTKFKACGWPGMRNLTGKCPYYKPDTQIVDLKINQIELLELHKIQKLYIINSVDE